MEQSGMKEDLSLQFKLPSKYEVIFNNIKKEYRLSKEGTIVYLLQYYLLEDSIILSHLYRNLLIRLSKGINKVFIVQLKVLYTALGHFLKKTKSIK